MHRSSLLFLLLAACAGTPTLPEGSGNGLLSYDREPPQGVEVHQRPTWLVGDRFAFRKGGQLSAAFRVVEAGDDGYVLAEEETGLRLDLTLDLAEKARRSATNPAMLIVKDPADYELHWPLWVGKKWECHFLEKVPDKPVEPTRATYHCEAEETIETSFGAKFRCLRILRTTRLEIEGRTFLDRTAVLYYAPEIGWFARRLEDAVLTEVESWHRQGNRQAAH